ncbi:immunity protein 35 of polymorphic toxin system [Chitinophaga dinghuensis]|uniref:Immunity protein 35 of polymorphic toxin system n=1 Tax=Chitinophaga dinghuensis TaxID=1539050 RepID=A0A327VM83_9BACT|nr:YrhB domain-containing protein [Chitinophaga dinghuensis]RAJ75622.1 immunity protein 35 of polymorphic toxin system [Chitinophaga dinghuensis]
MLTKIDAIKIAETYLQNKRSKYDLVLVLDKTKEFEHGWVFFWQSKAFYETLNPLHALGGNGPFIVNKFDGSVFRFGSAHRPEYYLEKYIKIMKENKPFDS